MNVPDEVFTLYRGDVVADLHIAECIRHLFDNPLHYHWNYPHNPLNEDSWKFFDHGFKIIKTTVIEQFGDVLILSFP